MIKYNTLENIDKMRNKGDCPLYALRDVLGLD